MNHQEKELGVYFIANDFVLELTIAFLNSFRKYNPHIPLCLIPFSSDYQEIEKLKDRYDFEILIRDDLTLICDRISKMYHGKVHGHYRKIIAWEGIYEKFIYIDIDTIVQHAFDDIYPLLCDYDYIAASSHNMQWVWRSSVTSKDAKGLLTWDEMSFSANTGFFCSKKGLLSAAQFLESAIDAEPLKPHMTLECIEQPLLNYLVVKRIKKVSSLMYLACINFDYEIPMERWAGAGGGMVKDGTISYDKNTQMIFYDNPTLFVHWAGLWQPTKGHNGELVYPEIPYKDLWEYYRHLKL